MTENNSQPYSAALDEIDASLTKLEQKLLQKITQTSELKASVKNSVLKIDTLLSSLEEGEK